MRKKKGVLGLILAMSLCLSACSFDLSSIFGGGGEEDDSKPKPVMTEDGSAYQGQTSTTGISSRSSEFETLLQTDTFYVVQNGYYYPLAVGTFCREDEDDVSDAADPGRKEFFTSENEKEIPTLYADCELVYYSTTGLLDYVTWERYYDMGYTIPIWNIQKMVSERLYLQLKEAEPCIYPETPLDAIHDLETQPEKILIDKIGQTQATVDLLDDDIFSSENFIKDEEYDLAVYDGTHYNHFREKAEMHAFKAYEIFASIEYETMQQENFYKIEIPEYLVTGYYRLNNGGFVRLVRGLTYTAETDYNEQLLYPEVDESSWGYDPDEYIPPKRYSTFAPLNLFETNQEGKLGYVARDEQGNIIVTSDDPEQTTSQIGKIKEATVTEVELWFPKSTDCTIEIVSSTGETTGDIVLKIGDREKKVPYNRLEAKYNLVISGKGQRGTLVISGLFNNYEIHIAGVEQYRGQDETDEKSSEETTNKED